MTKTEKDSYPILFLDFDGVLNSYEEGSYVTSDDKTYGPSLKICHRLRKFCENTGARIVISSNWRRFDEYGTCSMCGKILTNPLHKVRDILGDLIVGTLPKDRHIRKPQALILWMEDNDFDDTGRKWAVLDDNPDEGYAMTTDFGINDHYVETNPEFGITEEILDSVFKIMV